MELRLATLLEVESNGSNLIRCQHNPERMVEVVDVGLHFLARSAAGFCVEDSVSVLIFEVRQDPQCLLEHAQRLRIRELDDNLLVY